VQRVRERLPSADVLETGKPAEGPVEAVVAGAVTTAGADSALDSTERTSSGGAPVVAGEGSDAGRGVTCYSPAVAALVEEAVAEVRAPRPEIPRSRRGELDRALVQVRQLVQLDLAPPADEAERAKLAGALGELIAWATKLRSRLEPDAV
jgi:hypothetical protein